MRDPALEEGTYRTLFQSIDEAFCIFEVEFDSHGKTTDLIIVETNPAYKKITGLVDVVGARVRDMDKDFEDYWFEIYGQIVKTGISKRFTKRSRVLSDRWFEVFAFRIGNPEERKVAILFSDVTDKVHIEEKLKRSEAHLNLLMQSSTDYAIVTIDLNRKIADWNKGAENIFGYNRSEIVGQNFDIVYTEEDKKGELARVLKTAVENNRSEHDRWYVKKDGSLFWGSGIMMPIRGQNKELLGFLKIMRDQTKQKQIEEELRNAKKKAEEAAKAKEDFLAHMSHEIRTPLNAIVGLTNILLENPQPYQEENLRTLKFSAENLRILINDILDFSKIQAGKFKLKKNDIVLTELLDNLEKVHAPLASEHGNELRFYVDKKIPKVICTDQLVLSQILNNLINNAIKFTHNGLVKVHVHLKNRKGNQAWVDFSVYDTGKGISEEKLEKIFEAFTQEDKSVANPVEGTGLGLTITKLLIEHLGSKIEVESTVGKGSCFSFTLQLKIGKERDLKKERQFINQKKLKKIKVLVVEDVETNRNIIFQFLKKWWGLKPDEADNGRTAIEKIKANKYDIVLLDVWMPGMDGYTVIRRLRSLKGQHYKDLPVIALTANSFEELKKHPEASLFTDVITKPFEPAELKKKIMLHYTESREKKYSDLNIFSKPKIASDNTKKSGASKIKYNSRLSKSFSTVKLEDFFENDKEDIKDYLECILKNFDEFREEFITTIENRDEQGIRQLRHRKIMMMDTLGLEKLNSLLIKSKTILRQEVSQKQISEIKTEIEKEMSEVAGSINAYLKTL